MKSTRVLAVAAFAVLFSASAFAQSSKATVQLGQLTHVPAVSTFSNGSYVGQWSNVLSGNIKTSQQKDLIVGASLEVGLFTDTLVKSKGGTTDSSKAEAKVEVRVVLDAGTAYERVAEPGVVTFSRRSQELIAKFGGIMRSCTDANADGTIVADECVFDDETLQLIQETLAAHAFFFALDDVGTGSHTVTVQARISTGTTSTAGTANASAWVGKGAITVEESRLVKGTDISL